MKQVRSEEAARLRREKSREAISLALQGSWGRAAEVNQEILRISPEDVEAMNRLGKAFLALGLYSEARGAFERAAKIAPYNTISKKNLERLDHLQGTNPPPQQGKVVTPYLFIEESGKSGTTVLQRPAPFQVLAKMAAGDAGKLEAHGHTLVVANGHGEYLGKIEPKLSARLMRLLEAGNRYDVAIVSINHQEVSVIIWETHRHPGMDNVCSFPSSSKKDYKVHWKDALLKYDVESDLDEEEVYNPEWTGSDPDGRDLADGEETPDPPYTGAAAQPDTDEEDEPE